MAAIQVENLAKSYGDVSAVTDVSFEVQPGEVVALLGPNGAGKSTSIEILTGHRQRTSGNVTVLGEDPGVGSQRFRDRIGVVLQESAVDAELSIAEVLTHYGACYTQRRDVNEVLNLVGLTGLGDRRTQKLSGGQKRRIDIALGIIGDPDLLFLDEPTTGFDPSARRHAWEMVNGLRQLGTTIVLTSHYMDEVEALADRILVVVQGRIVAEGTASELKELSGGVSRITATLSEVRDVPSWWKHTRHSSIPWTASVDTAGLLTMDASDPLEALSELTAWADTQGVALGGLEIRRPSLEDVYLELIKRGER